MLRLSRRLCALDRRWLATTGQPPATPPASAVDHAAIVEDPPAEALPGMEPVLKYRLHAEQAYMWPAPPADNDSREIGPYPHAADMAKSYQLRSPHLQWDDPTNRRMFGEPIPEEMEALSVWMVDVEETYTVPYMLAGLATFLGAMGGLWWFGEKFLKGVVKPVASPRELPYWQKYFGSTPPHLPAG